MLHSAGQHPCSDSGKLDESNRNLTEEPAVSDKLSCSSVAYKDKKARDISADRILDCLWGENLSKRAIWVLAWLHFKANGTYAPHRFRRLNNASHGIYVDESYFRELEAASLIDIENGPEGEVHVILN
jgi:hypothetical protein